jgi:hypothetical protein
MPQETTMLHRTRALGVWAAAAGFALLPAAHAAAAPSRDNNPNAAVFTVFCPSGAITGSGAPGSALLMEGGGVAVLQGLSRPSGEVVIPVKPGLDRRGVLEECTYVSPFRGDTFIAFVQIVPKP